MALFHLTILSSQRKIFEGDIQSLVAPGEIGYFGVLANHAPFISGLIPGMISHMIHPGISRPSIQNQTDFLKSLGIKR